MVFVSTIALESDTQVDTKDGERRNEAKYQANNSTDDEFSTKGTIVQRMHATIMSWSLRLPMNNN